MRLRLEPRRRVRVTLTSLVDVLFVLLFFFMLASQSLDWRALPVDLARADAAGEAPAATVTTLVLLSGGELYLDGQALTRADAVQRLAAMPGGPREVMLVPGRGVSLQQTVDLIDALKPASGGAGFVLGSLGDAP